MKLILSIIQDEYINGVSKVLLDNKIRTTKLSSTGGFLKAGNTTLLIGVEDDQVDEVVELIRGKCGGGKVKTDRKRGVDVGGANLFIMDIDQYVKM